MPGTPQPIPPIDDVITFLSVEDLARSDAFYGSVLGLPLVVDQGSCRIYRAAGGYLGVCERPGAASPDGVIVTLVAADVDGWHDRLAGVGVPVEQAPRRNDTYGVYHAFYRDPDGYLLEIQRFLDPQWSAPAG
ncbi:MAG: VOC family protein [Actinobacteria bacterium]|nr:VOC family protein [Actinomycetota bacterium]